ncbi:MAG: hypothetical protein IGQ45_08910 [Cyanobacterium sp. T60_A2020_053]|nr:hypothetical protein [Cyanobacterium sp. T60_A2020_053]
MSTVTDNDLKELKDLLNSKFDKIDDKFEQINSKFDKIDDKFEQINSKFEQINEKIDNRYQLLDSKLNDMKVEIATIKGDVNGLGKRLDNLDFIARSVIGGTILALLLGLTKFLYPDLLKSL